ncbi:MAG: tRNA (adenosine(37)-N6)-threonylcarbamoyltransferase complex transferase subunit TsaD [bacterium]|jgi:N6-L-threonylcarbamoyladenine synthase|nr:tRNA (adenosine(37)-N6)-threonylcarbamoyltransferase complex transferase subunit TsaD [bacterium]
MILLGIESSCDESAAALIDGARVLSSVVSTQLVHRDWGGVVPELASREHLRVLPAVINAALAEAGLEIGDLAAVAATRGPGLPGSLLVGYHLGKCLAYARDLPFLGVNHMEGHIYASFVEEEPLLPCLVLVISGGHTQLVLMEEPRRYRIIGRTLDDAAGEAFDKVAKLLGLGWPGGPAIGRAAAGGDPAFLAYPRALAGREGFDFSFSGLKTAVLHSLRAQDAAWRAAHVSDICASFEQAVCDQLARGALRAAEATGARQLVLAGGVAANARLRAQLEAACATLGLPLALPPLAWCTDNAVMIARAAHGRLLRGERSPRHEDATPRFDLEQASTGTARRELT